MSRQIATLLKTFALMLTTITVSANSSAEQPVTTCTPPCWTELTDQPNFLPGLPLLLTDGRILVQDASNGSNGSNQWKLFSPDNTGSYINGTWSTVPNSPVSTYGPASAVLSDGRVYIMGGEHTNAAAVYDPTANTWATISSPTNGSGSGAVASVVLPNGTWMVQNNSNTSSAVLNPRTRTWIEVSGHGKADVNSGEQYTLLPDGSVLTVDTTDIPNTERFVFPIYEWISAGSTPVDLPVDIYGAFLIGPAILRPDGTVFATGACFMDEDSWPFCEIVGPAPTAIYTPPTTMFGAGTWTAGPSFPPFEGALTSPELGPAAVLPDGNVLVLASQGYQVLPFQFYEFDGTNLNPAPTTQEAQNAAVNDSYSCYPRARFGSAMAAVVKTLRSIRPQELISLPGSPPLRVCRLC